MHKRKVVSVIRSRDKHTPFYARAPPTDLLTSFELEPLREKILSSMEILRACMSEIALSGLEGELKSVADALLGFSRSHFYPIYCAPIALLAKRA